MLEYSVRMHIYKAGNPCVYSKPNLEKAGDTMTHLLRIVDETCNIDSEYMNNDHKAFCMSQIHLNITGFKK